MKVIMKFRCIISAKYSTQNIQQTTLTRPSETGNHRFLIKVTDFLGIRQILSNWVF